MLSIHEGHKDSGSVLEGEANTRAPTRGAPTVDAWLEGNVNEPQKLKIEDYQC